MPFFHLLEVAQKWPVSTRGCPAWAHAMLLQGCELGRQLNLTCKVGKFKVLTS